MFGFFRKKEVKVEEPRTDLVKIPEPVPLQDDAICFFDPFDFDVRKRSIGRLPQYRDVVVSTADAHEPEDEGTVEGEEKPPENWDEGDAAAANNNSIDDAPGAVDSADDAELKALIAKERQAVDDLRAALEITPPEAGSQGRFKEDLDLLRFLRARQYKIADAAEMYKKQLEWRAENKVDQILDNPDPLETMFNCYCGHRNHGYSYEGHPVYYERTGLVKVAGMLKHCAEEDIIFRHVRHMEYAMRRCMFSSMTNGRNVEKIIMIHDLAHLKFSVETVGVKIFTRTVTIDQNMYPERLHRVFIINAPLSFRVTWTVVKPFIDPKTSEKIKILGKNFLPSLLKQIPLDQLPEIYGGNCKCEYANGDHCLPWVKPYPCDDPSLIAGPWPKI